MDKVELRWTITEATRALGHIESASKSGHRMMARIGKQLAVTNGHAFVARGTKGRTGVPVAFRSKNADAWTTLLRLPRGTRWHREKVDVNFGAWLIESDEYTDYVRIHAGYFNTKLVKAVVLLAPVRTAFTLVHSEDELDPLYIVGKGFHGVVMPKRLRAVWPEPPKIWRGP